MKDKAIVLADSSYTIRRIVELSFSEIEDVEIVSFENGQELKGRLLEIKPRVVIIDVKLPGVSGYEICQLINQTDALKKTRVFLMKGSFEPINQEAIKNLKYEEIITKPFDSNLLVAAVMKIMDEKDEAKPRLGFAESAPPSLPEDFASIDTGSSIEDELNFSDIREDILTGPPDGVPNDAPPKKPGLEEDEIQPSEEITQAQVQKEDSLEPEIDEAVANPFESEAAFTPAEAPVVSAEGKEEFIEKPADPVQLGMVSEDKEIANEETSESSGAPVLETAASDTMEDGSFPGDLLESAQTNIELPDTADTVAQPVAPVRASAGAKGNGSESGISHIFGEPPELTVERESDTEGQYFPIEEEYRPQPAASETVKPPAPASSIDTGDIEKRLFEQMSGTIREALWEIIPRLAEKIIREEIDKIKSDITKPEV